ncbi:MAG TPA: TolC family protein, partial [Sulfuricurvum sp.]|nr:TolC family protein [Sulfuricurvum sp.]
MVIRFIHCFSIMALSASGADTDFLSPEKQSYYQQQQQQINSGYEKLRYNWVSPVSLKASGIYEKSAMTDTKDIRQTLSAGIAQDLFRSGGITYAIGYADAKKEADMLGLGREIATTNQQLMHAVLTYRKNKFLLEQSEIKLKNSQIEIFLKRQQYTAGDIDITLLNNALMNQSTELKNNTAIRYTLAQQKLEAAKLSDTPIDSILLPVYTLTPKEAFLEEGWDLRYAQALSHSSSQQYGEIKSSYQPKLTLIADAGLQRYDPQTNSMADYQGNFYDAGLQLSVPLTYNAAATTQEAQALYLKQQAQAADTKRLMEASYEQKVALIENYRRLITIIRSNLHYYDELIRATEAA